MNLQKNKQEHCFLNILRATNKTAIKCSLNYSFMENIAKILLKMKTKKTPEVIFKNKNILHKCFS